MFFRRNQAKPAPQPAIGYPSRSFVIGSRQELMRRLSTTYGLPITPSLSLDRKSTKLFTRTALIQSLAGHNITSSIRFNLSIFINHVGPKIRL